MIFTPDEIRAMNKAVEQAAYDNMFGCDGSGSIGPKEPFKFSGEILTPINTHVSRKRRKKTRKGRK